MNLNKDIRKKAVIFGMILALLFSSIPFLYLFSYNYQKNPNKVTAELKSSGNTWTVDDDGPADFDKIQDAIDVVSSGDVILVYPGLYIENLFIRKSLTIKSSNGPELTTILPHISTSDIIKVYGGNNVFIEGFTLADSHGQNRNAIYVVNSEFIYISNNKIINNDGGIRVFNSEFIYISNNHIEDFIYTGIIISSSDNCEVSFNFINGTGLMETAIAISGTSSTFSTNHLIEYNLIENCVSGIELGKIRNSMIKNNKVFYFLLNWLGTKGISIWTSDHTTIQNNICKGLFENILLGTCTNIIVTDNICNDGYYGIRLSYDNFNNQIEKNYCANNRYIGLSLVRSSYNTISTNTFVSTFIQEASDCIGNIFENNIFYQAPICIIELQMEGNEINEIDVGEFFDIYVGDSSDDIGIEQVRFSSDDEYNGIATGEWTDWYEWDTTLGDWDADAKIKRWMFATAGEKEVWAEINNIKGATDSDRSWITATSINLPPIAEFSYLPKFPIVNQKIKFDASLSFDPEGEIMAYYWDFGDGNWDVGKFTSHSFSIDGFHTVSLTVWDETGKSITISKSFEITKDWTYAIITDLHIGRGWLDYGAPDYNDYYLDGTAKEGENGEPYEGGFNCLTDRLMDVVNWINDNHEEKKIKFLAILGDITDTAEMSEFYRAKKILDSLEIPYIPIIGNHDIFAKISEETSEGEIEEAEGVAIGDYYFNHVFNEDFYDRQFENLGVEWQRQDYSNTEAYLQNFAFQYGGINFISVDFAQRYNEKIGSIASYYGETIDWIEENFRDQSKDTQIIFCHHPLMFTGGFVHPYLPGHIARSALAHSRDILTFSGHIHCHEKINKDFISNIYYREKDGKLEYSYNPIKSILGWSTLNIPVIFTQGMMEYDKDFIRLVYINGDSIEDIEYATSDRTIVDEADDFHTCEIPETSAPDVEIVNWDLKKLQRILWAGVGSPVEIRVYDTQGQVTGLINGEIKNEIPFSFYFDNSVVILPEDEDYRFEIFGTDSGLYDIEVMYSEELNKINFISYEIPIISGEIHQYTFEWDILSQGEEGVTIEVDSDGDGTIEHSFTSDNELNTAEYVVGTMTWPNEGNALQDGVVFEIEAFEDTLVEWLKVSIREPGGEYGIIISDEYEDLQLEYQGNSLWCSIEPFETITLPDGYYMLFVQVNDIFGFTSKIAFSFSIRNWAILELLPSTERSRAGRTMPVKFSLRVVDAVDPEMPFVWNEELEIIIYDENNPDIILQHSIFGDTSVDYRINSEDELYITNFKTSKTPAVYMVEIWRKGMLLGSFEFETYNSKIDEGNSLRSSFENFQISIGLNLNFLLLGMAYLLIIFRKKLIHL